MYFTKTETAILKLLTSKLTESFTIREISLKLKQNYSIIYTSVQILYKKKFLIKDKYKHVSLNCSKNHQYLAYIEQLKADEFLLKYKDIDLFINEATKKIELGFFILLIFGSYAEGKQTKKSDIDVLAIIENLKDVEKLERQLQNISEKYGNFHCNVISKESVKEMITKVGKLNVINETFNKHIIFFGAEDYYRLISENGR